GRLRFTPNMAENEACNAWWVAARAGHRAPRKEVTRARGDSVLVKFDFGGVDAEAVAGDQREHVGVDPWGRRGRASLGRESDAAGEPAGLAAFAAVRVAFDASAADRDHAHRETGGLRG